jgi:tRNA(Ile)-lysidine synthase
MDKTSPIAAALSVPAGAWAVGVSGGADSVALLELLRHRDGLRLHVVHLDHELRGEESAGDARFVAELAANWKLDVTVARYRDVEDKRIGSESNKSARLRAARFKLFADVVEQHRLAGVILAHHADDQAETIFQRLLRGSGPAGLGGMMFETTIGTLRVLRPILDVQRVALRGILIERAIPWREDASNLRDDQLRNRVRLVLRDRIDLRERLLALGDACRALSAWLRVHSADLAESFDVATLNDLPDPLARESAVRWLSERAGTGVEITPAAVGRLLKMAQDAASPSRQQFPGGLMVRRRRGTISAIDGSPKSLELSKSAKLSRRASSPRPGPTAR